MVAAALSKNGILSIIDVILIICGIYCIVTAGKMKQKHQIPQWLFSEQEYRQIRHPEKFCEAMAPKTIIFGIICMIFGAFCLIVETVCYSRLAEAIGIGILLITIAWYTSQLNKIKRTCV